MASHESYKTPRMADHDSHEDYLAEMRAYAAMMAAQDPLSINGQIAETVLHNYGVSDEEQK